MYISSRAVLLIFAVFSIVCVSSITVSAQPMPTGGTLRGENIISTVGDLLATPSGIYEFSRGPIIDDWSKIWTPPSGSTIVEMKRKIGVRGVIYLALLSDGTVVEVVLNELDGMYTAQLYGKCYTPGETGNGFRDVFGDAIYAQFYTSLYVSRDNGLTWGIDSVGLGGASISKATIDSFQYVYAATNKGIFWQHPDSSVWHKFDNFPAARASMIYVDRENRLFVWAPDSGIYISSNRGQAWSYVPDSKQIRPTRFGDDADSNIYLITGVPALYMLTKGTGPFTRIDSALLAITGTAGVTFGSVSKDSVLMIGTSRGLYYSSDGGATWHDGNKGIATEQFYYMGKSSANRIVMSTGQGIFSKPASDSVWVNCSPLSPNYFGGQPLFQDKQGAIYTYMTGLSSYFPVYFKTTDGGLHWTADSSAVNSSVRSGTFFADELGNQYIYSNSWNSYGSVQKKAADSSTWTIDTVGLRATASSFASCMGSDESENIYLGGSYDSACLFRKPIAGSDWQIDTIGISGESSIAGLTSDQKGGMIAASFKAMYHRTATGWVEIPKPSQISSTLLYTMTVDSLQRLFVAFKGGVYATDNMGTSWRYLGLDSLNVRKLISFGSTTYALTSNGAYRLNYESPVTGSIGDRVSIRSTRILHPEISVSSGRETLNIRYTTHERAPVSIMIFTLQGRVVESVQLGELGKGTYSVRLPAIKLRGGMHLCRLTVGEETATKEFSLIR